MSDQKRNERAIEFSGGVFTDMPVNERPCEYLENLLPPLGGGKGLEPRDGVRFLVRIPEEEEPDGNTHIYDVYNPDDMTQTHILACVNTGTNEITHLTSHIDQEGRKSIPPLGGGDIVLTPIAIDDLYFTKKAEPLTVDAPGVLSNDEDLGPDPTVTVVTQPLNGSVTLNPDGGFTYTPLSDFVGIDSFTYIISSLGLSSNVGRCAISVSPLGAGDGVNFDPENPVAVDAGDTATFNILTHGLSGDVAWEMIAVDVIDDYSDSFSVVAMQSGSFTLSGSESNWTIGFTAQPFDPGCEYQYIEVQLVSTSGGPLLAYPSKWQMTVGEP